MYNPKISSKTLVLLILSIVIVVFLTNVGLVIISALLIGLVVLCVHGALEGHCPSELLHRLASGSDQILELDLATLLVCSYDPASRDVTVASAGHPPPLYAPIVGEPLFVDLEPGPPLGVAVGDYPQCIVPLEAGSTLVLYSDGLIERRTRGLGEGMEQLRQAVRELRLPPEAVADHILSVLEAGGDLDDDVALLVLSHL